MNNYLRKKTENPLPPLPEDERIYFDVPYMARDFAKYAHCGFDPVRKLWFTGCLNAHLDWLVYLYDVNAATSDKARKLMQEALDAKKMSCKPETVEKTKINKSSTSR